MEELITLDQLKQYDVARNTKTEEKIKAEKERAEAVEATKVDKGTQTTGDYVYTREDGVEGQVQFGSAPGASTIMSRDSNGRTKVANIDSTSGGTYAANKNYVDESIKGITDNMGVANGFATLDANGHVPIEQMPTEALIYKGQWDASSGAYPADGTVIGDFYVVSIEGTVSDVHYYAGDWIIWNGTIWDRSANTNAVASVNGKTGRVELSSSDVGALPITGGEMQGPVSWNANSLPQTDSSRFLLTIDAFTEGGKTKWVSKEDASVGYATNAGASVTANNLAPGGTAGQVLTSNGTTAPSWQTINALPTGGTAGQVLTKTASGAEWANASSSADKMDKVNPTGSGSFSMNGGSVGTNAVALNMGQASGSSAFAEGYYAVAEGYGSHAEGERTQAIGSYAHAEGGDYTTAGENYSHAEGLGTIAFEPAQHVQGKYNWDVPSTFGPGFADIVGGGGSAARENISALDWDGNLYLKGNVFVGCSYDSTGGTMLGGGGGGTTATYIVDSNESLLYWLTNKTYGISSGGDDFTSVLIKKGVWNYSYEYITSSLTELGTKVIEGEEGSKIYLADISKDGFASPFFRYDAIPDDNDVYIRNVNIEVAANSKTYTIILIKNCKNISNFTETTGVMTASPICFWECRNIKDCYIKANHTGDNVSYGIIYKSDNISNCNVNFNSDGEAGIKTFAECSYLTNCSVKSQVNNGYGFSNCNHLVNCYVNTNKGYNTNVGGYYGFSSCYYISSCECIIENTTDSNYSKEGVAFSSCYYISNSKGVYLRNLASIGQGIAFRYCTNLTNCLGKSDAKGSDSATFYGCSGVINCVCDSGSFRKYTRSYSITNSTDTNYACAATPNGGFNT